MTDVRFPSEEFVFVRVPGGGLIATTTMPFGHKLVEATPCEVSRPCASSPSGLRSILICDSERR
eukprot:10959990-Lingulodinium_polyedra.AAC.1